MNICITGALGHIGSYLLRHFPPAFAEKIYLADNFLTQRYASLFDLPATNSFQFYPLDIQSADMEAIIRDSDVCIHLAAVTDAESSFQNRETLEKVNNEGFRRVADLCAKHQCALVFPSTTSVYGMQSEVVDETCKEADLKPQSPYAESKLASEKYLAKLGEEKGLKFIICRFGTIFGYSIGMRFHTAVNKFIWQAAVGRPISVWKTAMNQNRPYCGLQDAANAVNHIIEKKIFDGGIYNIVTVNLAVRDIVEVIREFVPDLQVELVDSPIMNQHSYHVLNEKSLGIGIQYVDELKPSIQETLKKLQNAVQSVSKVNI